MCSTKVQICNSLGTIQFLKLIIWKESGKQRKKENNTTSGTPSTWIWFHQCDRGWGQTPKTQRIQGVIDVGDPEEDVEAVDVGRPSGLSSKKIMKFRPTRFNLCFSASLFFFSFELFSVPITLGEIIAFVLGVDFM